MITRKRERDINLDIELSSKKGKLNTDDDDEEVINIPPYKTTILKQEYSHLPGRSYSVIFPLKLTSILESAFSSTAIQVLNLPPKLNYIGVKAFYSNNLLVDLVIPNSVTKIGRSAFEDNQHLLSVRFGQDSKLKTIGRTAFLNCRLLTTVVLPPCLNNIGVFAFSRTNLRSIVIYTNSIRHGTFHQCVYLREVVIRKSKLCGIPYRLIAENIFLGCINLQKLVLPEDIDFSQYTPISCKEIVWVISKDDFGCKSEQIYRYRMMRLFNIPQTGHTFVFENELEILEYFLMVTIDIDLYNWDYLSMKIYEYLERTL